LGGGGRRAFVTLRGRPMVEWSVAALQAVPAVQRIVVALPPDALHAVPTGERVSAVAGGAQRSHSVRAALTACVDGDPVIVHDAARPLATPQLFEQALDELARLQADAVIAAAPVTDTIKEVGEDGRTVSRTLDRTHLWAVQTPQVFRRAALERALAVSDEELARATDDAWLVERAGGVVRIVGSDPGNLKVTTREDLMVAELLLSERGS
jgi:2-C-methyl-D-erythritol 4-phosphate cytidylyltransferase